MDFDTILLLTILGAPLVAAGLLVVLRSYGARAAGWIAGGAAALSLAATFALLPALYEGTVPALRLGWIPAAGIQLEWPASR